MKKKYFILAFLLVFVGFFSSCENKGEEYLREIYSIKEGRIDITENEFITMNISTENTLVNSQKKLTIENNSRGDLLYGQAFYLEYLDEESWTQIQLDINFEDVGYVLKAGKKIEVPFYVSEEYFHRLGRYRIVKNFSLFSDFPFEIDSNFSLYVEFGIR